MTAALATAIAAASLHLAGVRRTMDWAEGPARPVPPADELAIVGALADAVARIERHSPVRGTCLSRSLALQWLLARRGVASALRLGGRIVDGRFEAHAWIEYNGIVVGSSPALAREFAAFDTAPAHAGAAARHRTGRRSA